MIESENKIKDLVQSIINGTDIYIVDIELKGMPGNQVIWVYLDTETGGISIDRCVKVSNELSILLDASELISGKYLLNVSSPGLDRPLKDLRQYKNNIGRKVKVRYMGEEGGKYVSGKLQNFDNKTLFIEQDKGEIIQITLENTLETKVLPPW